LGASRLLTGEEAFALLLSSLALGNFQLQLGVRSCQLSRSLLDSRF
jgi:hypothetical protein